MRSCDSGTNFNVREDLEKRLANLAHDDFRGQMWAEFNLANVRGLEDEVVLYTVLK